MINVHVDLKISNLIVSPDNIDITIENNPTKSRRSTLFNIQPPARTKLVSPLGCMYVWICEYGEWI